jgi:hypothetical protein
VTGFRAEDYPALDCFAEDDIISGSTGVKWVIPVIAICTVVLLLLLCSWCNERCCFKRRLVIEAAPKSNRLRKEHSPLTSAHKRSSRISRISDNDSSDTTERPAKHVQMVELEGEGEGNPFDDLEKELAQDGASNLNMVETDSTVGSNGEKRGEGKQREQHINYLSQFSDRVSLKKFLATPEDTLSTNDARNIVAQLRRLPLAAVSSRDFAINALVGLNSASLRTKLKMLSQDEVDLLEGRLAENSSSMLDRAPGGSGLIERASQIRHRATTLRDQLPDLPDVSSTSETDEDPGRNINRPLSYKLPNAGISQAKVIRIQANTGRSSNVRNSTARSTNSVSHSGVLPRGASVISRIGQPVRILVSFGQDKRTFRPENYDCYVALVGWVQDSYMNLPNEGAWRLEYKDSDEDVIRIASDSDIREALLNAEEANYSKLRINIIEDINIVRHDVKEGEGHRDEVNIFRHEPRQSSKNGESGRVD